eukprot:7960365-Pyramimonas_sp.AAC.1
MQVLNSGARVGGAGACAAVGSCRRCLNRGTGGFGCASTHSIDSTNRPVFILAAPAYICDKRYKYRYEGQEGQEPVVHVGVAEAVDALQLLRGGREERPPRRQVARGLDVRAAAVEGAHRHRRRPLTVLVVDLAEGASNAQPCGAHPGCFSNVSHKCSTVLKVLKSVQKCTKAPFHGWILGFCPSRRFDSYSVFHAR